MMYDSVLYELSLKEILTEKIIFDFKRYIKNKYENSNENEPKVLANALNRVLDKKIPDLDYKQKSKLKKIMYESALKKSSFSIDNCDVFKATIKLGEISHNLLKEFTQWINTTLKKNILPESLFEFLLFTKRQIDKNPEIRLDDVLKKADMITGGLRFLEKDYFIHSKIIGNVNDFSKEKINNCNIFKKEVKEFDKQNLLKNIEESNNAELSENELILTNFKNIMKDKALSIVEIFEVLIKKSKLFKNKLYNTVHDYLENFVSKLSLKVANVKSIALDMKYILDSLDIIVNKYIDLRNYSYLNVSKYSETILSNLSEKFSVSKRNNLKLEPIINILDNIVDGYINQRNDLYYKLASNVDSFALDLSKIFGDYNSRKFNLKYLLSNLKRDYSTEIKASSLIMGYLLFFSVMQIFPNNSIALNNDKINTSIMSIIDNDGITQDTINFKKNNDSYYEAREIKKETDIKRLENYKSIESINMNASAFELDDADEFLDDKNVKVGSTVIVNTEIIPLGTKLRIIFPENYKELNGIYTADGVAKGLSKNSIKIYMGKDNEGESNIKKEVFDFGEQEVKVELLK